MTETGHATPGRRWGAGRILLVVFGSLALLLALGFLAAGTALVWVDQRERDEQGLLTTPTERFETNSYALSHQEIRVGDVADSPGWIVDRVGTVVVRATGADGEAIFVGIGERADVAEYLAGVEHDEVSSLDFDPFTYDRESGGSGAPSGDPAEEEFWATSASGPGTQTAEWDIAVGDWSVVVMNADGSRGVAADVEVGAEAGWLLALGLVLGGIGLVLAALGALLLALGIRGGPEPVGGATAPVSVAAAAGRAEPGAATYPVAVEARLDEPLSRWLWLVKWLLAIPHAIVLGFLWIALFVLTVVAFFAILVTGRYPRGIFDFNVGVLRWTWRVGYYAFSAIATDRYPPFSLGVEPDYPATLEVPYPERLSRGLVLVKSWLLALPHLLVVAVFAGSFPAAGWAGPEGSWPGLIGLLTLVAGVILLFHGRYSRDLHDLLVGLNRWVYRVIAYVALMRDEYPPFRLGR